MRLSELIEWLISVIDKLGASRGFELLFTAIGSQANGWAVRASSALTVWRNGMQLCSTWPMGMMGASRKRGMSS